MVLLLPLSFDVLTYASFYQKNRENIGDFWKSDREKALYNDGISQNKITNRCLFLGCQEDGMK